MYIYIYIYTFILRPCRRPLNPWAADLQTQRIGRNRKTGFQDWNQWENENLHICLLYTWLLDIVDFSVPRWPFWVILGVLRHHLGTILQSNGSQMHTDGPWKVPGWIFNDFWWFLGPPLETILDHFLIFWLIWSITNHVWIAGMIFDDFWMEYLLIYDVPTLQKYTK